MELSRLPTSLGMPGTRLSARSGRSARTARMTEAPPPMAGKRMGAHAWWGEEEALSTVCSLSRALAAASSGFQEAARAAWAGALVRHPSNRASGRGDGVLCRSYHGGVYGCSVDQPAYQRDDHKVELAPGVAQVGLGMPQEAVREHLGQQLEGEDAQVDPLADANEVRLPSALGVEHLVEGRLPRHRRAVGLQRAGGAGSLGTRREAQARSTPL